LASGFESWAKAGVESAKSATLLIKDRAWNFMTYS
jgi:hypothetical protein